MGAEKEKENLMRSPDFWAGGGIGFGLSLWGSRVPVCCCHA